MWLLGAFIVGTISLKGCSNLEDDLAAKYPCFDLNTGNCESKSECYWGDPRECCMLLSNCNSSDNEFINQTASEQHCGTALQTMLTNGSNESLLECCIQESGCDVDDGYGTDRRRSGRGFSYTVAAAAAAASRSSSRSGTSSSRSRRGGSAGTGGGGGACFIAGTLIQLADGGWRRIEDIRLGDHLALGGRVTGRMEFEVDQGDIFQYHAPNMKSAPIIVAASHAVLEGGVWRRIRDSEGSVAVDDELWQSLLLPGESVARVYDLNVKKHRLLARSADGESIVFSDYSEIDADDSLSLYFEDMLLSHLQDQEDHMKITEVVE